MDYLIFIIPVAFLMLYVSGLKKSEDYGDEIMRDRDRRISDREDKKLNN